jgi:hypothetical protein
MKRKTKHKIKKLISIFAMTLIGIVMTWLGIIMIIENKNRNLKNVKLETGIIENTRILTQNKRVGAFPFSTSKKTDLFIIELKNTDSKLGTHNPKENYQKLFENLKLSDSVKIYYYSTLEYTNNIYQIEKNGHILVSHSEYKENHIIAGIVILIFGLFMFIMDFLFIKKYK